LDHESQEYSRLTVAKDVELETLHQQEAKLRSELAQRKDDLGRCGDYYTITLWFPCLDGLIQTRGNVARVKKSARNTSRRRVNSSNIPKCLDQAIQTRVSTNQSTRYIHVIV
jgi:hypothetical protein